MPMDGRERLFRWRSCWPGFWPCEVADIAHRSNNNQEACKMTTFLEASTALSEAVRPAFVPQENTSPPLEDFAPGIEAAFPHEFQECDCLLEATGGPFPDFVRGTYYLNGPARFGLGDL